MAQPTDTHRRFEVSDRSADLPVPALSRYARPSPAAAAAAEEAGRTSVSDLDEFDALEDLDPSPGRTPLELEPPGDAILQAADEAWASDPNPPQTVEGVHRTDSPSAGPDQTPALRGAPGSQQPGESPETRRKRPFWKRLAMARPAAAAEPPPFATLSPDALRPVLERVDHLTRRFEREQKSLHERLDLLEQNITRLWELEEQLSLEEVRGKLAVLQANQEEIADGLHALARNVAVGAGLAVAAFAGLLAFLLA